MKKDALKNIKNILWISDLEQLRGFGVPPTEYDSEAELLISKINNKMSELAITNILWDIFYSRFYTFLDANGQLTFIYSKSKLFLKKKDQYLKAARKIKAIL